MTAHQAPLSLGFSRQEHWSGLPFPSPMRESEKWKWSLSVVSDPQQPHGLQPTRLLRPWDFPGKSTGVGCHLACLALFKSGKDYVEMWTVECGWKGCWFRSSLASIQVVHLVINLCGQRSDLLRIKYVYGFMERCEYSKQVIRLLEGKGLEN